MSKITHDRPKASSRRKGESIGILGGTFDPPHRGHLHMARVAERLFGLDRIYFVPATHPWHKAQPAASYPDRFAMLALALAGHPRWVPLHIPERAATRQGASNPTPATYSFDQVGWLRRRYPQARVFFITGADSFASLPSWYRFRRLLAMCDFIILKRSGMSMASVLDVVPASLVHSTGVDKVEMKSGSKLHWVPRFLDSVSSTDVRDGLARSPKTVRLLLPAAVYEYAQRGHFYQA